MLMIYREYILEFCLVIARLQKVAANTTVFFSIMAAVIAANQVAP